MGAWGTGIYDNDDAADWGYELEQRGLALVAECLEAAVAADYVDAGVGARALAAADVVARLRSGGGETTPYAESVTSWLVSNTAADVSGLTDTAAAAVSRVAGAGSELYDLWEESDDLAEWHAVLGELSGRLA